MENSVQSTTKNEGLNGPEPVQGFSTESLTASSLYGMFKNDMALIYGRKNAQTAQKPEEKWPIHFCAF